MFIPKKPVGVGSTEYDVSNLFNAAKGVMEGSLCVIREENFTKKLRIRLALLVGGFSLFFLNIAFKIFPRSYLGNPVAAPQIPKKFVDAATEPLNSGIQKAGELKVSAPPFEPISIPNRTSLDTRARQKDADMEELIRGTVRK